MNREQMIAWLALEGWEPTLIGESRYARHPLTMRFTCGSFVRVYSFHEGAHVSLTPHTGWGSWGDEQLMQLVESASGHT